MTPAGSATAWYTGSAASAVARGVGGVVAGAEAGTAARVVDVLGGLVDVVDGAVLVVVELTVLEDVSVAAALSSDFPGFDSPLEPAAKTRPAPIAIDASAIALPTISVRRRMRAGGATYVVSGVSSMPGTRRVDQKRPSVTQPSVASSGGLSGLSSSVMARPWRAVYSISRAQRKGSAGGNGALVVRRHEAV